MKSLILFSVVILTVTVSCEDTPAQQITYGDHQVSPAPRVQYPTQIDSLENLEWHDENPDAAGSSDLNIDMSVMHAVVNLKTGQPFWFLSLPAGWKIISKGDSVQPIIKGPNGLNIIAGNSQDFVYSDKQDLNRMYKEMNFQVKKPTSIDSIFSEVLVPQGKEMGMTLLTHYPLLGVTANNIAYNRQFSVSTPQDIQKTEGSDWTDQEGNKVFIVMYYTELKSAGTFNWGYYLEILEAKPSYFEQAKKQFIYSISNKRFSKSEIDAYNDSIAEQKRTDEIIRSNNTVLHKDSTGKLVSNYDRLSYDDYFIRNAQKRSGSNRTQEEMRNDSVNVSIVVSPFDGKEYLVGSGFETYWINEKCQYIQSEDTLFDPNTFETQLGIWKPASLKVSSRSYRNDYQIGSGAQINWIDDQGRFIKSDDPHYDPNKDAAFPGTWQPAPKKSK